MKRIPYIYMHLFLVVMCFTLSRTEAYSQYVYTESQALDSVWNILHAKEWDELLPKEKIQKSIFEACNIIAFVIDRSLDICSPYYEGLAKANIKYGGDVPDLRGQLIEDTIVIYDLGLSYLDLACSTLLHEYCGHYMEKVIDAIKDTESSYRIEYEVNPFKGKLENPHPGQDSIPILVIISPLSTVLEEINGYFLEFEINSYNLTKLEAGNLESIIKQLKKHREASIQKSN